MIYHKEQLKKLIIILYILLISILITNSKYNYSENLDNKCIFPTADDKLNIEFLIEGPSELKKDELNIVDVVVKQGNITLNKSDIELHEYHVYSDKDGKNEVLSGELEWNTQEKVWEKKGIKLAWTGFGTFYVTVEFKTKDMKESYETEISDDPKYSYQRMNVVELVIYLIIVGVIGIVIVGIILMIHHKKSKGLFERETKQKKKSIKIKNIKKEKEKPTKKEKEEKKEKGKTEITSELIFSVPKWEEEDENDE